MSVAVCVFCSSSDRIDQSYVRLAEAVGEEIARRGWTLVSGGGSVSCMGAVARTTRAGGARTVGVIPEALVDSEVADHDSDELIVTADMRQRKAEMDRRCRRVPRAARRHRNTRGAARDLGGPHAGPACQAGGGHRPGRHLRAPAPADRRPCRAGVHAIGCSRPAGLGGSAEQAFELLERGLAETGQPVVSAAAVAEELLEAEP